MKNIDNDISIDAVHALLLDFNVPSHLIGFNLLADAIVIKINDPCAAVQDIYSAIAVKHDKSVRGGNHCRTHFYGQAKLD